ncbi:membrane protein insertase YidC [Paenibacillus turpanensis]|uniref:membrane protein insertase YidC n=1 Tax=Paenibacillus turpanensis TaxID=2689078 RepID=UPI00140DB016|nr:membrane protein insertase YidC [Paenibacillus turpanensis]
MSRKRLLLVFALSTILVLSGCSAVDPASNPIDPNNGFWDRYFVFPISFLLDWFAELTGGQYGLAILFVTIIIRLLVLPLTLKQYKSSKAMQLLQPQMQEIRKKFKDNPQKQQEETMKLFTANGVNPLAGCFPLLVQMPILIALYNAIMRNGHIREHTFLGMQLGEPNVWVLPILAAITTYLQYKVMPQQPNAQMQSLMLIFPVLIFVMAMQFPSALALYWVYGNIFTIIQSYFIYGDLRKGASSTRGVQ